MSFIIFFFFYRVQDICSSYLELLQRNNVTPLIVFDGLPLPGKKDEHEKRARYIQIILTDCYKYYTGSHLSSSAITITPHHLCCIDCLVLNSGFGQKIKIKPK